MHKTVKQTRTNQNGKDISMWKQSLSFFEAASWCANVFAMFTAVTAAVTAVFSLSIVAAVTGILAAISAFISWYASKMASEITQSESEQRIAAAEQKAADANEKAEKERHERQRIEARLAPRALSRPQELSEKLKPFAGTSVFVRGMLECGPDVIPLTNQIISVLKAAEWKMTIINLMGTREYVEGIIVAHSEGSDEKTIGAVDLVIRALIGDGIDASHKVTIGDEPNSVRIVIGSKP
jgi:hypothetical protein